MLAPSSTTLLLVVLLLLPPASATPVYLDPTQPVDARVADIMSRMTLQEKVNQLLCPWPVANFTQSSLSLYNSTSYGAAMTNGVNDPDPSRPFPTHFDVLNWYQDTIVSSSRLGIPVVMISEILHSSTINGTVFPGPAGLGATWDTALMEQIGAVIGLEARTAGIQRGFGPVLQVATDPRFGRFEESYGEDPYLVSEMAASMVRGLQGGGTGGPSIYIQDLTGISIELKHMGAYAQAGRDGYSVRIDDDTLFNVYLRPWRTAVGPTVGARGLMVTHPEVNGLPAHGNTRLLNDILRQKFGAEKMYFASDAGDIGNMVSYGVVTDGPSAAILGLVAGMDQDNALGLVFPTLAQSVPAGNVPEEYLERAVANILREKFALRMFDGPQFYRVNVSLALATLDAPAHRMLAYQAATESIVLLKNDGNLLPLSADSPLLRRRGAEGSPAKTAILGPNGGCDPSATWDCVAPSSTAGGYSNLGAHIVTVLEAAQMAAARPNASFTVSFAQGANITDYTSTLLEPAVALAAASDVAVIVVGDTALGYREGSCAEGVDADTIDLPGGQLALIDAVTSRTTTPVIVVLIHGRPVTFGAGPFAVTGPNNALLQRIPALVAAWRPGEEGGTAVWDVLTGAVNPSGRLTQNWLRSVGDIRSPSNPYFQARGSPDYPWTTEPTTPLFWFGSGLSYTNFTITNPGISLPAGGDYGGGGGGRGVASASLSVSDVFNVTGSVQSQGPAGTLVVQVYYSQDAPTKWVRYDRQLLCFGRVDVPANSDSGAGVQFSVPCAVEEMLVYDRDVDDYVVFSGNYTITLATDASPQGVVASFKVAVQGNSPWQPGKPWLRG